MSESKWHFSLCVWEENEGIKSKQKQEGIESMIFFLKLVGLKSSKRCTPGKPEGLILPYTTVLKHHFFFTDTKYHSSGFHKLIEIYCKLIVGLKENCKYSSLMD